MATLFSNGNLRTPTGLKVHPQSYDSLEEVAIELRKVLPLLPSEKFKIDCKKVLEKTLPQAGYNYKVTETDELDECAAFTIPELQLVVLREDIYELLQAENVFGRSTVIHETSHIVLNHAITLHRGAPLGGHRFFEDSEWQAKALTAAVMMPIEACKQSSSPAELADLCGTSIQSARYRLDRLVKSGKISRQVELWSV